MPQVALSMSEMGPLGFNEAEAPTPRMPALHHVEAGAISPASMRPRRQRLGCPPGLCQPGRRRWRFNEAEAPTPRMHGTHSGGEGRMAKCFNEAEAPTPRMLCSLALKVGTGFSLQ